MHVTTLAVCSHIIPSDYTLLNTKHAITCMITSIPCRFHVLTPKTSLTCMTHNLTLHSITFLILHLCRNPHACTFPFCYSPIIPENHSFLVHAVCFIPTSRFVQTISGAPIHFWQIPLTCCSKDTCILIKQNTYLQILSMPCAHYLRNPSFHHLCTAI